MRRTSTAFIACLALALYAFTGLAPSSSADSRSSGDPQADGRHDFDWELGTWKTHVKRRLRPLSGSNEWVEYEGITTVTKVWNGRANIVDSEGEHVARVDGVERRCQNRHRRSAGGRRLTCRLSLEQRGNHRRGQQGGR